MRCAAQQCSALFPFVALTQRLCQGGLRSQESHGQQHDVCLDDLLTARDLGKLGRPVSGETPLNIHNLQVCVEE